MKTQLRPNASFMKFFGLEERTKEARAMNAVNSKTAKSKTANFHFLNRWY